ncbi:phospholipase D-like domain-containing protein [Altericroceibacterium xinjiangense]|uniref:phospholipase D-like domain-containing protein n=1 Tax=Altericroceibacterium xinjiangense TaxID=762261 RepID=UPI000F7EFC81|nr:phospholipase D-like domain-containing protein [Altericroceibacterium xinjiangense]
MSEPGGDRQSVFDDRSVEPGVWRYARASRARVIVDAADYFALMQQAMLRARNRVLLIGWDFDTRIHLAEGRRWWQKGWRQKYPVRLGSFLLWLVRHNPALEIRMLHWSYGALKFLGRGSMLLDLARWWPNQRIDFKFDHAHPAGCSHHQKIAVIDNALAVCGGIDMTIDRWDTREHREHDERRRNPSGDLHKPWHDATMMLEGDVAEALGDLGRDRWVRAGGKHLAAVPPTESSAWPEGLAAQFENVEIGISRTRAEYGGNPAVHEIETLFLAQIARARRFIYAESQFFASRAVAEALADRLREENPPEVVIVHAAHAETWIEQQAMDYTRVRLVELLREVDRHGRFHLLVPYTGETPIYCHAKIMVVDDEILRIGSANFNNRSMQLDSECDVFIDCARPANSHCGPAITGLRHSLLAEHLGLREEEVGSLLEQHGSMGALVDACGPDRPRSLRRFEPPSLSAMERTLADSEMLDPERVDEVFHPMAEGRGLFRSGGLLSRARHMLKSRRKGS